MGKLGKSERTISGSKDTDRNRYGNAEVAATGVYPSIPDTNAHTSLSRLAPALPRNTLLLGLAPATVNTNMHVKMNPARTQLNMILFLIVRCFTLLYMALLCSVFLCFALLCFALRCFPLQRVSLSCVALRLTRCCYGNTEVLFCFVLLCFALLCSVLLYVELRCVALRCLETMLLQEHRSCCCWGSPQRPTHKYIRIAAEACPALPRNTLLPGLAPTTGNTDMLVKMNSARTQLNMLLLFDSAWLYFAVCCFALLCFALLCSALLCFALRFVVLRQKGPSANPIKYVTSF